VLSAGDPALHGGEDVNHILETPEMDAGLERDGRVEEADLLVRYPQARADCPRTHFFNRIRRTSD